MGQYSSVLTIESVLPSDGGRYSCRPSSDAAMTMPEAEVNLHVVNGEMRESIRVEWATLPVHLG